MKRCVILIILLVFGVLGFNPLGKIRWNEPVNSGEELEMHVNVVNNLDKDMEDTKVRIYFPDLGIIVNSNPFDFGDKSKMSKFLFWETDDIEPGEYLAKIVVSNDHFRDVKYRYITII